MKVTEHFEPIFTWHSEVAEGISGKGLEAANAIDWADNNPIVWDIVMNNRSRAFGVNSKSYDCFGRGTTDARGGLARVNRVRELLQGQDLRNRIDRLLAWNIQITMEHYKDADFSGGLFEIDLGLSLALDYVPATLAETIERYYQVWSAPYVDQSVMLDGVVVRKWEPVMPKAGFGWLGNLFSSYILNSSNKL